MAIRVSLRTDNGHYLCAETGGGREMIANRTAVGPWETFTVERLDQTGALLMSGDRVALRTANGQYLCAENGGGGEVVANRTTMGPWETFTIVHADLSGGEISSGQGVLLRTANGQFLCAEGGGGREVTADRAAIGPWETFTAEIQIETLPEAPPETVPPVP